VCCRSTCRSTCNDLGTKVCSTERQPISLIVRAALPSTASSRNTNALNQRLDAGPSQPCFDGRPWCSNFLHVHSVQAQWSLHCQRCLLLATYHNLTKDARSLPDMAGPFRQQLLHQVAPFKNRRRCSSCLASMRFTATLPPCPALGSMQQVIIRCICSIVCQLAQVSREVH
jgi:hypothetical protein